MPGFFNISWIKTNIWVILGVAGVFGAGYFCGSVKPVTYVRSTIQARRQRHSVLHDEDDQ